MWTRISPASSTGSYWLTCGKPSGRCCSATWARLGSKPSRVIMGFTLPRALVTAIKMPAIKTSAIKTTAIKRRTAQALESTKEMTGLVEQACLVAKDAAFNLRDFLENSSNMAFIAVKDCEKELDRAERKIDDG